MCYMFFQSCLVEVADVMTTYAKSSVQEMHSVLTTNTASTHFAKTDANLVNFPLVLKLVNYLGL